MATQHVDRVLTKTLGNKPNQMIKGEHPERGGSLPNHDDILVMVAHSNRPFDNALDQDKWTQIVNCPN